MIPVPILGEIPLAPLAGSFLAIVVSVIIAVVTVKRTGDSSRKYIDAVKEASQTQIDATKKASKDQMDHARFWIDVKRRQLLRALINELEQNLILYNEIKNSAENEDHCFSFALTIIEHCLYDTPIDLEDVNRNLLKLHSVMKMFNNDRMETAQIAALENLKSQIDLSTLFEETIKRINGYEEEISCSVTSKLVTPIEPGEMQSILKKLEK